MLTFYQEMYQLLRAVDLCITNKLITPALVLLYSAIDIAASIERVPSESTKASFIRWIDQYLLPGSSLGCTALDLYAARCGVVHALSPSSDLFRSGKAKQIVYAWGTAEPEQLRRVAEKLGWAEIIVHVDELIEAFRRGLLQLQEDLDGDPARASAFEHHVDTTWFAHMPKEPVSRLDDFINKGPDGRCRV